MSNDDDRSQLPETELEAIEDAQFETSTEATAGDITRADVVSERKRLDEMDAVAEGARGLPDARVRYLIQWIHDNLRPGVRLPSNGYLFPGTTPRPAPFPVGRSDGARR